MLHILLAEDDEVMREYLTRALTRSGYRVTAVDRGTAALPLLDTEHFDLLLTDIVMPEMDGIELAQRAAALVTHVSVSSWVVVSGSALGALFPLWLQ